MRDARGALGGLEGRLPPARLHEASLCLSELVTNAIQHPGSDEREFELTVLLGPDTLRVEVTDPGSGFEPAPPTEGDERGWGLFIVDQLATSWGAGSGERTTMWFEISTETSTATAGRAKEPAGEPGERPEDDRLLRAVALRRAHRIA